MPDIDALRLRLLRLGQPDPQHSLAVFGFDRVAVDVLGERERADEPSLPALASVTPDGAVAGGTLARHHELTLARFGREVLGITAGNVQFDHHRLLLFPDVYWWQQPSYAARRRPQPEHPLEAVGHRVQLCQQWVTTIH